MFESILAIMNKVIIWIKMNFATVFGTAQALLKVIKEILTGIINLFSIFVFTDAAEVFVMKVRGWVEVVDGWLEKVKEWLLANVINK